MTAGICEFCPFVRSCPDCIYQGGTEPEEGEANWARNSSAGSTRPGLTFPTGPSDS